MDKIFINHIDKVDLSEFINISEDDTTKLIFNLLNNIELTGELKELFNGLSEENKKQIKEKIDEYIKKYGTHKNW